MTTAESESRALAPIVRIGEQIWFHVQVIIRVPRAIRAYRAQVGQILAEMSLGAGLLVVGGGAVGVVLLLAALTGTEVGVEGHEGLDVIGLAPLTGFISGYANTRELAPIVVALAYAARIGCGFTSRIGAIRINEEIDALESMSIEPIAYLASTRLIAGVIMVLPLFLLGLVGTYVATDWMVTTFYGQSQGTYSHYFTSFVSIRDVMLSALKVLILTIIVTLIHCYHGFHATGGPEGVGRATGHAIRTSIIAITVVDILLTLLLWGPHQGVTIAG